MGDGVALPHARLEAVRQPFGLPNVVSAAIDGVRARQKPPGDSWNDQARVRRGSWYEAVAKMESAEVASAMGSASAQ